MTENRERWGPERRASAYAELEHPSDLFLEIHGRDPQELLENALFAFYDEVSEMDGFEPRRELTLEAGGAQLDDALRALLSEALFYFDTEGFVAVGGTVTLDGPDVLKAATSAAAPWRATARLRGDNADRERHTLLHEVKAVTYHRLAVSRVEDGWTATVLLDL
jgi:SHS2 domain-containing protein